MGPLVDELQRAIEERLASHIVYRSARATEPVTYEIYPYGLVLHRSSLYLVAYSREHGEIRHFKVNRIVEVDVSRLSFHLPPDFDLAEHLAGSFGVFQGGESIRVRVRFSADVARYVAESRWHRSQRLEHLGDGRVVIEFQLSGTEEVKHWILGFGAQAEVLAPKALRDEILSEAKSITQLYASAASQRARDGIPSRRDGHFRENRRRSS